MVTSYTEPIKQKSREVLWGHAVTQLTKKRSSSRILSKQFIARLWDYSFDEVLVRYGICPKPPRAFFESWVDYSDSVYERKSPRNLKVAYLSGPEPENDLKVLLSLGVVPENVWAIESDAKIYQTALLRLHKNYPTLKLFHGTFSDFIAINPVKFDILYIDSTKPIFSRDGGAVKTINSMLETQALSELSALIVNSALPEATPDNVEFLSYYFYPQEWVEGTLYGEKNKAGKAITWETEGPISSGYEPKTLKRVIADHWEAAYSAFCTHYPIAYASSCSPITRILSVNTAKRQLFDADKSVLDKGISRATEVRWVYELLRNEGPSELSHSASLGVFGPGGDMILSPTDFPFSVFLLGLKESSTPLCRHWSGEFSRNQSGVSREDSIRLGYLMRNVQEGYFPILSENLRMAIPKIMAAIPDRQGGLFCDIPMIGLWIETAMNQLGFPYHSQIKEHFRISYCAKKTTMMADVFVYDKCRAFYDWLPMFNLYSADLTNPGRQIIARACMHVIEGQVRWITPNVFKYSALAGYYDNDHPWNKYAHLPLRITL